MIITDDVKRRFTKKVDKNWGWVAGKNSNGYGCMAVSGKTELAHRIGYEIYIGKIPEGLCVLHSCDIPACVNPEHLHLGTQIDNIKERTERGRGINPAYIGEDNPRAKLTKKEVIKIRKRHKSGESETSLAKEYGVSQGGISAIVLGKTWKHI